jgi:hypothetical protein
MLSAENSELSLPSRAALCVGELMFEVYQSRGEKAQEIKIERYYYWTVVLLEIFMS